MFIYYEYPSRGTWRQQIPTLSSFEKIRECRLAGQKDKERFLHIPRPLIGGVKMDVLLTDKQRLWREQTAEFARQRIFPEVEAMEQATGFQKPF